AERLYAQADVALPRQGGPGVLEGLPEGAAAVSPAIEEGSDVQVGVKVDDPEGFPGPGVAEEVAVGGLVPAAQDDGDGPGSQQGRDDLARGVLVGLEVGAGPHVPQVEQGEGGQVEAPGMVPGGQLVEPGAPLGGGPGGAAPPAVALHPFVLG